jgi:chemotaxis protein CheD
VAVALNDPPIREGGMAQIVLPEPLDAAGEFSTKFATIAVPHLIERVIALGGQRGRLACKIAGGAQVLPPGVHRHGFRIGERNIEAVKMALQKAGLSPLSQDCGGTIGRSFRLVVGESRVAVKRLGNGWQEM